MDNHPWHQELLPHPRKVEKKEKVVKTLRAQSNQGNQETPLKKKALLI